MIIICYYSEQVEFEVSLIKALRALFLPVKGEAVAVLRFWALLSVNLIANLDIHIFPQLASGFQVCL